MARARRELTAVLAPLERWLDRELPGLGLRLVLRTVFVTLLMSAYWMFSGGGSMPRAFYAASRELTGVPARMFHVNLWSHALAVVLLLLVPLAVGWLTERQSPRALGLGMRHAGRELRIVAVFFALLVPVLLLVSQRPSFQAAYPRVGLVGELPWLFFWFHLAYLVKWVAWEFFFRGYLLFAFARDMQARAIIVSTVPFALMHFGKPPLEMLSAVFAGFILCWLAWRGRSIWPGVLLHWAVNTTVELFGSPWFWALFA